MLQPKRTKFRKTQKGRNRGLAERGSKVSFGEYALKATGRGRITARQIEAARRAATRHIKRGGKIWIRIFPTSRLPVSRWKFAREKVRATLSIGWRRSSRVECCMRSRGVSEQLASEAFDLAAAKLPVQTTFVNGR